MLNTVMKKELIAQKLRQEILDGTYPVGSALPGELHLVKKYGVARETLRNALQIIADDGLLEKVHGKGNFVRFSPRKSLHIKHLLIVACIGGDPSLPCHTLIPKLENYAANCGMVTEVCDYFWLSRMSRVKFGSLLEKRQIDGLIIIANNFSGREPIVENLRALPMPVVLPFAVATDLERTSWPGCVLNLGSGWIRALRYLHSLGHRRVATMAIEDAGSLRGINPDKYGALLRDIGLDDDPALMAHDKRITPFSDKAEQYTEVETLRILNLPQPPTAIICHSDCLAGAVYRAAERTGRKIPEDLAVMGFVSGFNCRYITPALSSIEMDMDDFCEKTFSLIKANASDRPRRYDIALNLARRESTENTINH